MIRTLFCAWRGHKVDYFPNDPPQVERISYSCRCKHVLVTKADADKMVEQVLGFNPAG